MKLLDRLLRECGRSLSVSQPRQGSVDPDDLMLLRLNLLLSPAERLAQMGRLIRLRGLAR